MEIRTKGLVMINLTNKNTTQTAKMVALLDSGNRSNTKDLNSDFLTAMATLKNNLTFNWDTILSNS